LEFLARLRAFEEPWCARAKPAGWTVLQLYGLDPVAPRARIGRMGAAFLACLRGHQVAEVDRRAVAMVTRTGSRLRLYQDEVDAGVVRAWTVTGA
jgi:hypothetical protein